MKLPLFFPLLLVLVLSTSFLIFYLYFGATSQQYPARYSENTIAPEMITHKQLAIKKCELSPHQEKSSLASKGNYLRTPVHDLSVTQNSPEPSLLVDLAYIGGAVAIPAILYIYYAYFRVKPLGFLGNFLKYSKIGAVILIACVSTGSLLYFVILPRETPAPPPPSWPFSSGVSSIVFPIIVGICILVLLYGIFMLILFIIRHIRTGLASVVQGALAGDAVAAATGGGNPNIAAAVQNVNSLLDLASNLFPHQQPPNPNPNAAGRNIGGQGGGTNDNVLGNLFNLANQYMRQPPDDDTSNNFNNLDDNADGNIAPGNLLNQIQDMLQNGVDMSQIGNLLQNITPEQRNLLLQQMPQLGPLLGGVLPTLANNPNLWNNALQMFGHFFG